MNTHAALHPTEQTLSSFALGKLDDASSEAVNKHLEECPDCRKRAGEMSADSFLERVRDAQARPDSPVPLISSTAGLSMVAGGSASSAPPPTSSLPPGLADHPDYEIIRELGRGGMGVVYLAQNKLMGRTEVLKVVGGHLINRPGVLERFQREIRSAANLHHPNIVTAYAALRTGESLVFAMEYVEGYDLAQLVRGKGPLQVAHACNFAHQAALGLQYAHEKGMVHRDIKPSNLMVAREGKKPVVKVLDFGLAKVTSEGQTDSGLTRQGQMLGTPDFSAPEQIRDAQSADIRADVYSLGCTFYYLLTGGPPFQGDSLWDLYQAHFSMDATPLNLVRPEVPVEVAAIVAKMMAKEPGRRFQEPKEVAQALKPFFKAGNVAVQGQVLDVSRAGQTGPGRPVPGLVSTPTQPATVAEGPVIRPNTEAEPAAPAAPWQSLIDLRETERSRGATPAVAPIRRRPWFWPSVAVGALILGLLIAWGVVIRFKTTDGMIELVNLPQDAEVLVDGKVVAVTWPGGGKPATITVPAGKRKVEVKKDGFEVSGDEVTILAGVKEPFTVRLIPLADSRPKPDPAADRTARSDDAKTPSAPIDRGGATPPPTSPPVLDANSRPGDARSIAGTPPVPPAGGAVERPAPPPEPGRQAPPAAEAIGRTITDRMLVIKTRNKIILGNASGNFQLQVDRNIKATLRDDKVYINEVFGRKGVLCTAPLSPSSPGTIDFSRITHDGTGSLILRIHSYPRSPGGRIVVKSDGVTKNDAPVEFGDAWKKIVVPFRRNEIVVEHHALGWMMEFMFIDYEVVPDPRPETPPGIPTRARTRARSGSRKVPGIVDSPQPAAPAGAEAAPATDPPKATVNPIGMKLVLIPAGEFQMGSPEDDEDAEAGEKPRHRVQITRPFYLGVTEVTQGQYRALRGNNPSHFRESAELPVEGVSWFDAVRFCNRLSQREGRKPYYGFEGDAVTIAGGDGYRLPTETEWEYACRAGSATRFSFGDDESALRRYAWYVDNSNGRTHLVGRKQPNAFGLYDMHGNVYEWCWDPYDANRYKHKQSPAVDPQGPGVVAHRVIRGGSLEGGPQGARSALRHGKTPKSSDSNVGFRLARDPSVR
jgi:formylglycine-generating enzyme required for sulfatase activity/serine/threonine protein kinase